MVKKIFWILVINFVLILSQIFIPAIRNLFRGSPLFFFSFATLSVLGVILIFLTIKKKVKGKLKGFLLLTGISSPGFFMSVLLHNFLYALAEITKQINLLSRLFEVLHVIFFIIAVIVCPIGFLVGIIGSLLLINKKERS